MLYPGLFVERRRDLVDRLGGGRWLHTGTRRTVELESEALHERCELWVERSQDDVALLRLFSPSFVSWLAEHRSTPASSTARGRSSCTSGSPNKTADRLSWMLDATAQIARRLRDEVSEAAGASRHA